MRQFDPAGYQRRGDPFAAGSVKMRDGSLLDDPRSISISERLSNACQRQEREEAEGGAEGEGHIHRPIRSRTV